MPCAPLRAPTGSSRIPPRRSAPADARPRQARGLAAPRAPGLVRPAGWVPRAASPASEGPTGPLPAAHPAGGSAAAGPAAPCPDPAPADRAGAHGWCCRPRGPPPDGRSDTARASLAPVSAPAADGRAHGFEVLGRAPHGGRAPIPPRAAPRAHSVVAPPTAPPPGARSPRRPAHRTQGRATAPRRVPSETTRERDCRPPRPPGPHPEVARSACGQTRHRRSRRHSRLGWCGSRSEARAACAAATRTPATASPPRGEV
jgi:hypothetical protein